jgi:ribosomal protein S18 acetylase RimI-like enzyme
LKGVHELRGGAKIRAFDGSQHDAEGMIEVDRATFGDCLYTPEYILSLESDPGQYAWVAEEDGQVVGFVSAFATHSLATGRWEVDELAVHPKAQGRGIGTALVICAVESGSRQAGLSQARALVAVDNDASARVFHKCGFAPVATVHLLLYSVAGREPRLWREDLPAVRSAGPGDCSTIARLSGCDAGRAASGQSRPELTYLVAEQGGQFVAFAELIHVRTLQYEGFWIESIALSPRAFAGQDKRAASALFDAAIEEAKCRESFNEVGYLASPGAKVVYEAAVGEGFKKTGEYRVFVRDL